MNYALEQLDRVVGKERWRQRGELKQHAAQRPDVALLVVLPALTQLGGEVQRSANGGLSKHGLRNAPCRACQARCEHGQWERVGQSITMATL